MENKVTDLKSSKPYLKTPVFYGTSGCFLLYFVIVALGFFEVLSEKAMERIDIVLLIVGLIAYIGDTSGFYERHPKWLTAARTVTLGTISLSLSIHLFTYKNLLENFSWFVVLAVVLTVTVISALVYKAYKFFAEKR
ncbi:hypothetical protein ACI0X9_003362 [Cronobacter turicensis]